MISSCTLEKLRIKSVQWPLSCETPCRRFTKNENYRLLFDLCIILKGIGILSTAAIRKERMKGCENEMKKMDRVTHRYDKCVNLCSNYANPEPFLPVNTWDRVNKKHININCPDMIKDSKKSIVGVGLADMLASLCRKTVKAKRWCLKILS